MGTSVSLHPIIKPSPSLAIVRQTATRSPTQHAAESRAFRNEPTVSPTCCRHRTVKYRGYVHRHTGNELITAEDSKGLILTSFIKRRFLVIKMAIIPVRMLCALQIKICFRLALLHHKKAFNKWCTASANPGVKKQTDVTDSTAPCASEEINLGLISHMSSRPHLPQRLLIC